MQKQHQHKVAVVMLSFVLLALVFLGGCLLAPSVEPVLGPSLVSVECEGVAFAGEQVVLRPDWRGGGIVDVYVDPDGQGWTHLGADLPSEIQYTYYQPGTYTGKMRVVDSKGRDHDDEFDIVVSLRTSDEPWRWEVDFALYVFIDGELLGFLDEPSDFTIPQGKIVTVAIVALEEQTPRAWPYGPKSLRVMTPESMAATGGIISLGAVLTFPGTLAPLSFDGGAGSIEEKLDMIHPVFSFKAEEIGLYYLELKAQSNVAGSELSSQVFTFRVTPCPDCGK